MKIHEIKRNKKLKKKPVVGRGGKRGKTSGRGTKGQKARSGHKIRPEVRDVIKKLPKLRGRGKNINTPVGKPYASVKISDINPVFKYEEVLTPAVLYERGLIKKVGGKFPRVKIVGNDKLEQKLIFKNVSFSESARKSAEEAKSEFK